MDNPDISVIIPAYNVECYVARAIESALNQQGVTLEVIVVDDASTDNTWSAICRNTDPRVKRLRLDSNGGPSAARNTAIAQATGVWLAMLDADDIFLPDRLARCLKQGREQNADIVVDNLTVYREAEHELFPMFPPEQFAAMRTFDIAVFIAGNKLFLGGYTLGYVKPVFSTAYLRDHHLTYNHDIRIGEDYLLLAEALASGAHCAVEPSLGYQYTVRAGAISVDGLSLADITRISQGDAQLLVRYRLSSAALQAQRDREKSLKTAYAFTKLVEALNQHNTADALKAVALSPGCIWLLWLPSFRSGQTHAQLLLEHDGTGIIARTTNVMSALVKALLCFAAALVLVLRPHRMHFWLLRGSLHAGVVSRLLGHPIAMSSSLPTCSTLPQAQGTK